MTRRKIFILTALVFIASSSFAQVEVPEKKSVHYVGVQANQLIRQLFNFGGSTPAFDNPYLITYSVNSVDTGLGVNLGLGYTHNEFMEGDAFAPRETVIKDFFFRAGIERKISIGKKWLLSSGVDIVTESKKNKTVLNPGSGGFITDTKTTATGIGPRFTLHYRITDRILFGTEATYYYKGIQHQQTSTGVASVNDRLKSFTFAVPAVLFLVIKF